MTQISEIPSNIKLDPIAFVCDKSLGDHIQEPWPNNHHFMCLCGMPGGGKTTLAMSLLTTNGPSRQYRKVFNHILLFMPEHSQSSLKNSPFKNHDPEKIFDELNYENLEEVYARVRSTAEDDQNTLLIIDDMTSDLKNHDILKLFMMLINNRRHLRLSIWILVQSYIAIPLNLRKTISHLCMFKPANKKEYFSLFDELLHLPKQLAEDVTQWVFKKNHDFLMVNVQTGELYKNHNKLILSGNQ